MLSTEDVIYDRTIYREGDLRFLDHLYKTYAEYLDIICEHRKKCIKCNHPETCNGRCDRRNYLRGAIEIIRRAIEREKSNEVYNRNIRLFAGKYAADLAVIDLDGMDDVQSMHIEPIPDPQNNRAILAMLELCEKNILSFEARAGKKINGT